MKLMNANKVRTVWDKHNISLIHLTKQKTCLKEAVNSLIQRRTINVPMTLIKDARKSIKTRNFVTIQMKNSGFNFSIGNKHNKSFIMKGMTKSGIRETTRTISNKVPAVKTL